jgi:hypothetical protein
MLMGHGTMMDKKVEMHGHLSEVPETQEYYAFAEENEHELFFQMENFSLTTSQFGRCEG